MRDPHTSDDANNLNDLQPISKKSSSLPFTRFFAQRSLLTTLTDSVSMSSPAVPNSVKGREEICDLLDIFLIQAIVN